LHLVKGVFTMTSCSEKWINRLGRDGFRDTGEVRERRFGIQT
jgi:hypothetical protein